MGGCAASINKTFTTALAGGENALPPLVAGATTFAPLGSVSLDSQSPKGSLRIQFPCHLAKAGALWVLSIVPHYTTGKRRVAYSPL